MKFVETALPGVLIIDIEPLHDARGFFARTWCRRELAARGLSGEIEQSSLSFSPRRGTLRGMHYQAAPHEEIKLVRCTRGAIYDVAVDLRPDSPAFRSWTATELTAENRRMLYFPKGVAHGFLTLQDDTEVQYQMSHPYVAAAARGVRWNDPAFGIVWPARVEVISERDGGYPDFAVSGEKAGRAH